MQDLWQRRFAGQMVDLKEKAKQGRFLQQRGYAVDDIRRLLDRQTNFYSDNE